MWQSAVCEDFNRLSSGNVRFLTHSQWVVLKLLFEKLWSTHYEHWFEGNKHVRHCLTEGDLTWTNSWNYKFMFILKLNVIQKYGQYSLQSWCMGYTSETGSISCNGLNRNDWQAVTLKTQISLLQPKLQPNSYNQNSWSSFWLMPEWLHSCCFPFPFIIKSLQIPSKIKI